MTQYLASQGDVWDALSYRFWKDEQFIAELLNANPKLRHIVLFDKPELINVPDRPEVPVGSPTTLPPWKQASQNGLA
jgi:phage tail protein X